MVVVFNPHMRMYNIGLLIVVDLCVRLSVCLCVGIARTAYSTWPSGWASECNNSGTALTVM